MEYFSTRGSGARISASEAIAQGLAPDGGLFVPAQLPPVTEEALRELLRLWPSFWEGYLRKRA